MDEWYLQGPGRKSEFLWTFFIFKNPHSPAALLELARFISCDRKKPRGANPGKMLLSSRVAQQQPEFKGVQDVFSKVLPRWKSRRSKLPNFLWLVCLNVQKFEGLGRLGDEKRLLTILSLLSSTFKKSRDSEESWECCFGGRGVHRV